LFFSFTDLSLLLIISHKVSIMHLIFTIFNKNLNKQIIFEIRVPIFKLEIGFSKSHGKRTIVRYPTNQSKFFNLFKYLFIMLHTY